MVGAHAAFTLSDDALAATADLAKRYGTGVHLHVAEDPCDAAICHKQYGAELVDRLDRSGVLAVPSILAHGTHLAPSDLERINRTAAVLVHNPRSNMNNAVGYALLHGCTRPILLGTDGLGSDMLAELAAAWFKARDANAGRTPADCVAMLAASARKAGELLGIELGRLTPGAAADIVLTDYVPPTPLNDDNVYSHLIFGLASRSIDSVMVAGQWRLRNRRVLGADEAELRHKAVGEANRLWSRMGEMQ